MVRMVLVLMMLLTLCSYGAGAAQGTAPSPTPTPWHVGAKATADDVKTLVTDVGVIVVTALGIILLVANGKRIYTAATNAALTITIPLIGNLTLPARAAAEAQLNSPPPATGLPPPTPGPVGKGAVSQHLVANPSTVAALNPHPPEEVVYYRRFYSALFVSQLRLLESVATSPKATVSDARSVYDAFRAYGQPLTFERWLDYPRKYGMIGSVAPSNLTAPIVLTERGADFLHWASLDGRGSDDLAAQGRTA
jgi:hypothetical protein